MRDGKWETHFLPLLVLTRWSVTLITTSTGNKFPKHRQGIPRVYYQRWRQIWRDF